MKWNLVWGTVRVRRESYALRVPGVPKHNQFSYVITPTNNSPIPGHMSTSSGARSCTVLQHLSCKVPGFVVDDRRLHVHNSTAGSGVNAWCVPGSVCTCPCTQALSPQNRQFSRSRTNKEGTHLFWFEYISACVHPPQSCEQGWWKCDAVSNGPYSAYRSDTIEWALNNRWWHYQCAKMCLHVNKRGCYRIELYSRKCLHWGQNARKTVDLRLTACVSRNFLCGLTSGPYATFPRLRSMITWTRDSLAVSSSCTKNIILVNCTE